MKRLIPCKLWLLLIITITIIIIIIIILLLLLGIIIIISAMITILSPRPAAQDDDRVLRCAEIGASLGATAAGGMILMFDKLPNGTNYQIGI